MQAARISLAPTSSWVQGGPWCWWLLSEAAFLEVCPIPEGAGKMARLWAVRGSFLRESLCLLVGPAAEGIAGQPVTKNSPNRPSKTLPFWKHTYKLMCVWRVHLYSCKLLGRLEKALHQVSSQHCPDLEKECGCRLGPRGHSQSWLISRWNLNHFFSLASPLWEKLG